ncbi:MAG: hypothetical protein GTO17_04805 [Candidatus Aminicenantes bacterium]|nr:hypothetical protein [Candidatus Aminicenantes bacterium]
MPKEKVLRFNLYIGLFVLIFSESLLILGVSFIKDWFYSFAWWSFILIMDSLNFRRTKRSPLSESTRLFLFTAFISVFVWLIFELFNLRLRNWTYHDLPPSLWERWIGYFVAFASVILAIKEIAFFIRSFFKGREFSLFKIRITSPLLWILFILGVFSVVLSLAWPRIFFPFVWLCFIFLLEPLNFRLKNRTFLREVEEGKWSHLLSWILAGLVAGMLWEFWNFWATSHWKYSLPYLNLGRVFQMPIFGYTGFLPFALEIFAIDQSLFWVYRKLERKLLVRITVSILLLFFYGVCFYLIDTFTLIR